MRLSPSAKSKVALASGAVCLMLAGFVLGWTVNGYRTTRDMIHSIPQVTSEGDGTTTVPLLLYGRYDGTAGYIVATILAVVGLGAVIVGSRLRRARG